MTVRDRNPLDQSRSASALALVAILTALGACAQSPRAVAPGARASDIYERSTHRLTRVPSEAGACIAEHARSGGHSAEMLPLYGMESVAVTIKTGRVGELLAVLSLTRSDGGSVAATTTWAGAVRDREAFVRDLVQGC